ncbi:family 20 glycosylhydrolase [Persicirhabdus sediminis]|uniref:beta-N-acetylhexosaminidase n=1 Tax=Persicirhabdus sediminis TaxID=454144 RepID=A0A8J7SIX3_9BACT|nr:family 20 glycosylhydrolase [Persicirhabdus sediminis]MBK1790934.1 family 20 glycosylhydrolase [Persicirhabdus sediminis]
MNDLKKTSRCYSSGLMAAAVGVWVSFSGAEMRAEQSPVTVPATQPWSLTGGELAWPTQLGVFVEASDLELLANEFAVFKSEWAEISKADIKLTDKQAAHLVIELDGANKKLGEQAYQLEVGDQIKLSASTNTGIFYGLQTLSQLAGTGDAVAKGMVVDQPKVKQRAMMVDCGRRYFEIEYLEKLMRQMARLKMNVLHLHFTEWNGFRLKSEVYPGLASEQAYSKKDIRHLQDYAAKYHIEIVPEIDLPAHATWITNYAPELGFKSASMRQAKWQGDEANEKNQAWVIDVSKRKNREWINNLLNEWIPLFDSQYFHIGGDEWQYDEQKNAAPEMVAAAMEMGFSHPGDIFVDWINEVNELVKSHGKTTQIWNWWNFSPNKTKRNETSIHPADDIVINVWNRPRQKAILDAGYQVILTPESGKEGLYVTPGKGEGKPGDYGYVRYEWLYDNWKPLKHEQVLGYKMCLWADGAEENEDDWFNKFYQMPLAVMADRVWGGPSHDGFKKFEEVTKQQRAQIWR